MSHNPEREISTFEHASIEIQISSIFISERCSLIIHLSKCRCAIFSGKKRFWFLSPIWWYTCTNLLETFEAMFESWNVIMDLRKNITAVFSHYVWNCNQCAAKIQYMETLWTFSKFTFANKLTVALLTHIFLPIPYQIKIFQCKNLKVSLKINTAVCPGRNLLCYYTFA